MEKQMSHTLNFEFLIDTPPEIVLTILSRTASLVCDATVIFTKARSHVEGNTCETNDHCNFGYERDWSTNAFLQHKPERTYLKSELWDLLSWRISQFAFRGKHFIFGFRVFWDPEKLYMFNSKYIGSKARDQRVLFAINPVLKEFSLTCTSRMIYSQARHCRDSIGAHDVAQYSIVRD